MSNVENEKKPSEIIKNELDICLQNELSIRNILDSKILTLVGVIVGLLTFTVPEILLPRITMTIMMSQIIILISTFLGFLLISFAIVRLLIVAAPQDFAYIDFDKIVQLDESTIKSSELTTVLNKKKLEILIEYREVNIRKSRALYAGMVLSLVGIFLIAFSIFLY